MSVYAIVQWRTCCSVPMSTCDPAAEERTLNLAKSFAESCRNAVSHDRVLHVPLVDGWIWKV
jgi:hypothetical protein